MDGEDKKGVYFLSFEGYNIRVHQLIIPDSLSTAIEWKILVEIPNSVNMQFIPTKAALINNSIYIQGGIHGCG